jgi:hypothetical protein
MKESQDSWTVANAIAPKAGVPPEVVLEFITTWQTKVVDMIVHDSLKERLKHDLKAQERFNPV